LSLLEEKWISAKYLLNQNIDVNLGGGRLGSPIHIAMSKLDYEIISDILKKVNFIQTKKKLIFFTNFDFKLKKGGDPNSQDEEGNSPFHLLFCIFSRNP
jgi:ankyrin repeat protein